MGRMLFLAVWSALAPTVQAQTPAWPSKQIRIVVPVLAGSFTDVAGRSIAAELSEQLGVQVIVENRAGAGTTLGAEQVARAAPDGHSLYISENSFAISPALYPKLPYDPLRDFAHLTVVAEAPYILWSRVDLPVKSPRELVALARAKPGNLTFGSAGQGTSSHLAAEVFFDLTGMQVLHVPFKGVVGSIAEVAAGRVDFGGSSIASPIGQIRAGKLKPIAVTGRERSPMLPDVPTFAESGFPEYDVSIWFGMSTTAGTPTPILARLHQEIAKAVAKPAVRDLFAKQGAVALTIPAVDFTRRIESELKLWRDVVTRAKIKLE